jgi:hypothetical protein
MRRVFLVVIFAAAVNVLTSGSSQAEKRCDWWFKRCLGNRIGIYGMMGTCEERYAKAKQVGYWIKGKTGGIKPCQR